ncbi:hypothetical protein AB1Y20_010486 [Prymnesium parvum]|uniref:Uncharacterized protein n=1 Tax=Prymnesium parvum TaxID=97485 RepID=A0AB34INR4_PRYPA
MLTPLLLVLLPLCSALVLITPLRSDGALQCLPQPVTPVASTYASAQHDGCALECDKLGAGSCVWFAQTRTAEGYECLVYASQRNALTVPCSHNQTALVFDTDYVVWERTPLIVSNSSAAPAACPCVCASVTRVGEPACDEAHGTLNGCYAHKGSFNEHPLYEQQGPEPAWLYFSSDADFTGWLLDSHPAPGHFDARRATPPSGSAPLGTVTWDVTCASEQRRKLSLSADTYAANIALQCQQCPPPPPPVTSSATNGSCALLDELAFYSKEEYSGRILIAGTIGGEAHAPIVLEASEHITSLRGRDDCDFLACWLIITTSTGRAFTLGSSYFFNFGNQVETFTLKPDPGYGVLGVEAANTGLRLVQRQCGLVDPPQPPSPPSLPSPPSPPPHAPTNLLTLNGWQLTDPGGELSWKFAVFEHGGEAYLRTSRAMCTAKQVVDLREPRVGYLGYTPAQLYSLGFHVRVHVAVEAYNYFGLWPYLNDFYYAHFALQNAAHETIAEWSAGSPTELFNIAPVDGSEFLVYTFEPYEGRGYRPPPYFDTVPSAINDNPAFVVVEFGGRSGEQGTGAFGAHFSDWSVEVIPHFGLFPPSFPSPQPASPPCPPPPSPPSPPVWPPISSCPLLEVVTFQAGFFVDRISFQPRANTGLETVTIGEAGGWPQPPLTLDASEFIQLIRGRTGCGFLACWIEVVTSAGQTRSIGQTPEPTDVPSYELRPTRHTGVAGLVRSEADPQILELIEHPCHVEEPPAPPSPQQPPIPPLPPPAPPAWPPSPAEPPSPPVAPLTCTDGCPYASDGDCDDGGPGAEFAACLFGMDCTDCGVRVALSPPSPRPTSPPLTLRPPPALPNPPAPPTPPALPPLPPQTPAVCSDGCIHASDNDCDDGGPGAEYQVCSYGDDCSDCGKRPALMPTPPMLPSPPSSPPRPPSVPLVCDNSCDFPSDGLCDDGGVGSEFDWCHFGRDCDDCGGRAIGSIAHFPTPPPTAPRPFSPPSPLPPSPRRPPSPPSPPHPPSSPPAPPFSPLLCQNSCPHFASDGDCDDGGPGSEYDHCSTGADCADCGHIDIAWSVLITDFRGTRR